MKLIFFFTHWTNKCNLQRCHNMLQHLFPKTLQAFTFHSDTFLNLHYLTSQPSAVSLILFPKKAEGICANPESGVNLLLHVNFELVNQPHLFLTLALHWQELYDTGRLVDVDAHGGGQGELDVHILAVVPELVTGARPTDTPRPVVLSEATGPILALPGCTLTDHPDHHPAIEVHFPVPSMAEQTLLRQHLKQRAGKQSNISLFQLLKLNIISFCLSGKVLVSKYSTTSTISPSNSLLKWKLKSRRLEPKQCFKLYWILCFWV